MWIELLRPYRLWSPGQRFNMGGGEADLLIQRNIAKRVEDEETPIPAVKKKRKKKTRLGTTV